MDVKLEQQNICEFMSNFYDWLIKIVRKDYDELKVNNYHEDFYEYYKQVERGFVEKKQEIGTNINIMCLNTDSIERLKVIIDITKEEYKEISATDEKDIIYFNTLLGWYEGIIPEINICIDSLLKKQT
jgi:transcription termination factor NusB